jgi:hypothetical protein
MSVENEQKELSRKEKHDLALKMFSAGKTIKDVMNELKISKSTAYAYYNEYKALMQTVQKASEVNEKSVENIPKVGKLSVFLAVFVILAVIILISIFQYSIIINNLLLLVFADGVLLLGGFAIAKYVVSHVEDAVSYAMQDTIGNVAKDFVKMAGSTIQNVDLNNVDPKYVMIANFVMPYIRDYLPRELRNNPMMLGAILSSFFGRKSEAKAEEKPEEKQKLELKPGEIRALS